MKPDFDTYMPMLAELDLTDDQKRELIEIIWDILENFVDRAFQIDPTQSAMRVAFNDSSQGAKNTIDSNNTLQTQPKGKGMRYEHP